MCVLCFSVSIYRCVVLFGGFRILILFVLFYSIFQFLTSLSDVLSIAIVTIYGVNDVVLFFCWDRCAYGVLVILFIVECGLKPIFHCHVLLIFNNIEKQKTTNATSDNSNQTLTKYKGLTYTTHLSENLRIFYW